jgi:hypothetical protein
MKTARETHRPPNNIFDPEISGLAKKIVPFLETARSFEVVILPPKNYKTQDVSCQKDVSNHFR